MAVKTKQVLIAGKLGVMARFVQYDDNDLVDFCLKKRK